MQIEIVTHCHRYWRLLTHQLSSFCLHPPKEVDVRVNVFYSPDDRETRRVLDFFGAIDVPHVEWYWYPQTLGELRQRAIGRNLVARSTSADIVWFTDADILFREGVLDRLPKATTREDSNLFYPRTILASRDHASGDETLRRVSAGPRLLDIDPAYFGEQRFHRAIGPVQICRAIAVRETGYCDCPRFQKPAMDWTYASDVRFRRILGTSGTPIQLPGVYRIRHSHSAYRNNEPVDN